MTSSIFSAVEMFGNCLDGNGYRGQGTRSQWFLFVLAEQHHGGASGAGEPESNSVCPINLRQPGRWIPCSPAR